MAKYARALEELSDEDWKTQCAQKYKNVPQGEIVKVIEENFRNYYGVFARIEYDNIHYYVKKELLEFLEMTDEDYNALKKKKQLEIDTQEFFRQVEQVIQERDTLKKQLEEVDYRKVSDKDLLLELWNRCQSKRFHEQRNDLLMVSDRMAKGNISFTDQKQIIKFEMTVLEKNSDC